MVKHKKSDNESCGISSKLSIDESEGKLPPVHSIISGILVSLICGFILSKTLMYRTDARNIFVYIFCIILFSLLLGIAISYGIKKHKYKNKKNIFIFMFLCSILIYFIFNIIFMYIKYHDISLFVWESPGPLNFLVSVLTFWPLTDTDWMWIRPEWYHFGYVGTTVGMGTLVNLLSAITFHKIHPIFLVPVANSLIWFSIFIINVFCTWIFIILTCPHLSKTNSLNSEKSNWLQTFIKKIHRRFE